MATKTSSTGSMSNMKMIGAAIVVIIIVAVGAVFLLGNKGTAPAATTTVSATTNGGTGSGNNAASATSGSASTAPTTIAQQNGGGLSFQSLVGQNLSLSEVSSDLGHLMFNNVNMLNATYTHKSRITLTGSYAYSINTTGTTTVQKYYNDSRVTTTSSVLGSSSSSVVIYNATSKKGYVCASSGGGSVSCQVSATAASIVNSTDDLNLVKSEAGSNTTVTGYFNNIKVSSASYKGMPCTLLTGNLYVNVEASNGTVGVVMHGTTSSCTSTQYNTYLNQSLVGSMVITTQGRVMNATIDYISNETSISGTSSAAITALPGPVVSS